MYACCYVAACSLFSFQILNHYVLSQYARPFEKSTLYYMTPLVAITKYPGKYGCKPRPYKLEAHKSANVDTVVQALKSETHASPSSSAVARQGELTGHILAY